MNDHTILIVDDEPLTRKSLYEILKYDGYNVFTASDGQEAWEMIVKNPASVVLTDLKMPRLDGLGLLRQIKQINADIAVVLMTAHGSIESAVEAMKEGAFDYVVKPILDNEIKIVIERIFKQRKILEENKILRKKLADTTRSEFCGIVGQDSKMQKVYNLIEAVASTNATVLIQGESGTGKRLVAQAVHKSDSLRKNEAFIEVSCGALPENLLESELFGHVKGSFTSAVKDRQGRFEASDRGSIFLDEIDAFSPSLQVKLLRVLQEGEFERVGDTNTIKADIRVIAATNRDLKKCIKEGNFREDLYYRLNVIPIQVPALRERKSDIPLLVEHFLNKSSQRLRNKKVTEVSKGAMDILFGYDWPGNIRELENVIERAVILSESSHIKEEDLGDLLGEENLSKEIRSKDCSQLPLKEALRYSEKEIIQSTLTKCRGNRKKAAELLSINRTTLYNKMKEYDLLDV